MEEDRRHKASPLAAAKTILFSFLGIRRRSEHAAETVRLTPVQIVVAGVIGAAVLVLLLVALVKLIVASAG
jgi:hypothetical protein